MKANLKVLWKTEIIFLLSKTFCFIFKQKHVIFYSLKSFFFKFLIIQLLQHFFAWADTKIKICFTKSLGFYRLQKQIIFWKCNIMLSGHKSQHCTQVYFDLVPLVCALKMWYPKKEYLRNLIICLRKKKDRKRRLFVNTIFLEEISFWKYFCSSLALRK